MAHNDEMSGGGFEGGFGRPRRRGLGCRELGDSEEGGVCGADRTRRGSLHRDEGISPVRESDRPGASDPRRRAPGSCAQ